MSEASDAILAEDRQKLRDKFTLLGITLIVVGVGVFCIGIFTFGPAKFFAGLCMAMLGERTLLRWA